MYNTLLHNEERVSNNFEFTKKKLENASQSYQSDTYTYTML